MRNPNGIKKLALIIALISILGCQTELDMKEQQKRVIENYIKSYNDFDINGMTKDLTDNVVFENVSNGNVDLRTKGIKRLHRTS